MRVCVCVCDTYDWHPVLRLAKHEQFSCLDWVSQVISGVSLMLPLLPCQSAVSSYWSQCFTVVVIVIIIVVIIISVCHAFVMLQYEPTVTQS